MTPEQRKELDRLLEEHADRWNGSVDKTAARLAIMAMIDRRDNALDVAVKALEAECKPFRFPDEDRPICHDALSEIQAILKATK